MIDKNYAITDFWWDYHDLFGKVLVIEIEYTSSGGDCFKFCNTILRRYIVDVRKATEKGIRNK